jgi:membrane protease YdiL (CAAX protease family)
VLSEKPWQVEHLLRLLAGLLASMSVGVLLAQGLQWWFPGIRQNKMALFFLGTVTFHLVTLGLVEWFLKAHSISWKEAFGFNRPKLSRALLLGIGGGLIILPIALALGHLSGRLMEAARWKVEVQPAVEALQTSVTLGERVYFGCVAIFVAPFVEEIIFRGILYPFIKQAGRPQLALWLTSIVFALSHANIPTLVPLIAIGLFLALLYERADNLLAPIAAHSVFNAANFFLLVNTME